jgi:hypothetical protein
MVMPRYAPNYNRIPKDKYFTPAWVTRALIDHWKIRYPIWEPCAGDGRMAAVLQAEWVSRSEGKPWGGVVMVRGTDVAPDDDAIKHWDIFNDRWGLQPSGIVNARAIITTTRLSSRISGRRKALCSETVSFENRPSNRWATGERREPCCVTPLRPSRPCRMRDDPYTDACQTCGITKKAIEDGHEPRCAEHPLAEGARVMFLDTHKAITTIPITGMSVSAKARFREAMSQGGARAARGSNDRLVLADGSDIPIRKPDPNNTGPGYTGAVPTFGEVGERQYGTSYVYVEMVQKAQDKATRDLRAMIKTLGR